jgi:hypothetical protein
MYTNISQITNLLHVLSNKATCISRSTVDYHIKIFLFLLLAAKLFAKNLRDWLEKFGTRRCKEPAENEATENMFSVAAAVYRCGVCGVCVCNENGSE